MKKLLLVLALLLAPSFAMAQCNGVFPNNTVCGNTSGASSPPHPTSPTAFQGSAGGTNGQTQYNNGGALGGYTPSGGATVNPSTGVVSLVPSAVVTAFNAGCAIIPNTCSAIFGYSNIIWYGADPTGVADSGTAIGSAITTAMANHSCVYIPAGLFKYASALPTITSHICIYGTGKQSIAGICSFNLNCSTTLTTANLTNGANLLPGSTINGLTISTNDAIDIHGFQIVYLTPPTGGSGLANIKVSGLGGSFGVNSATTIYNMLLSQGDVLIQMNDAVSFWISDNVLYNFVTTGLGVGGTGIANGNDWNFNDNKVFPGPNTGNNCVGLLASVATASNIQGNKFNFITAGIGCSSIQYTPTVDGTAYEPIRIVNNSMEGTAAGVTFFNECPTQSTCTISQWVITGNQLYTGSGFNGGTNITISGNGGTGGATPAEWVSTGEISSNILITQGGAPNNKNIDLHQGYVGSGVLVTGNVFGNASSTGSVSITNGGSNGTIVTRGNIVNGSTGQVLGTGTTAPFTASCGATLTNTLTNMVEMHLFGGTGVTQVFKNASSIYNQGSSPLPFMTIDLDVGESVNITCSTPPGASFAALNP